MQLIRRAAIENLQAMRKRAFDAGKSAPGRNGLIRQILPASVRAFAKAIPLAALASLAFPALPAAPRAAQLDPEDAMVEEFQSFCGDYYTSAQCVGAVRFILKTSGSAYFIQLQNEKSQDGFLDRLAVAVKGGEALRASEAVATKAGN